MPKMTPPLRRRLPPPDSKSTWVQEQGQAQQDAEPEQHEDAPEGASLGRVLLVARGGAREEVRLFAPRLSPQAWAMMMEGRCGAGWKGRT